MTKRRRKSKSEDQYGFITKHERNASGEIELKTTDYGRVQLNIRGLHSFLDTEETFQVIRALVVTGACQWGPDYLERVKRYLETVKVI